MLKDCKVGDEVVIVRRYSGFEWKSDTAKIKKKGSKFIETEAPGISPKFSIENGNEKVTYGNGSALMTLGEFEHFKLLMTAKKYLSDLKIEIGYGVDEVLIIDLYRTAKEHMGVK